MSTFKTAKVGVYGPKTRLLQARLSYERTAHTMKAFLIHKYEGARTNASPTLDDVQDSVLMEVRDRAYNPIPVQINGWYEEIQEQTMDLTQYGIVSPLSQTYRFRFHSWSFRPDGLGRHLVVGDVIEVPFLEIDGKKALFEVNDVDRKLEPEKFVVTAVTTPMRARQETAEIDGYNEQSLFDNISNGFDDEVSDVQETGVELGDIDVVDDLSHGAYDPRPAPGRDFLDDPNAEIA